MLPDVKDGIKVSLGNGLVAYYQVISVDKATNNFVMHLVEVRKEETCLGTK